MCSPRLHYVIWSWNRLDAFFFTGVGGLVLGFFVSDCLERKERMNISGDVTEEGEGCEKKRRKDKTMVK